MRALGDAWRRSGRRSRSSPAAGSPRSCSATPRFPLLRLGYAEEGGELGRLGVASAAARRRRARRLGVRRVRAAAAGRPSRRRRPPGPARDHAPRGARRRARRDRPRRDRRARERRHDPQRLRRRRRERDLDRGRTATRCSTTCRCPGAKLDGIHVRLGGVMIKDCTVDMLGNDARPGDRHLLQHGHGHEHGRGLQRRRRA